MLFSYLQQTQLLLNDVKQEQFNLFDLTTYVNKARNQLSADAECIRIPGTLMTQVNVQSYPFSQIVPSGSGVAAVLNVRLVSLVQGTAQTLLDARSWEWFYSYYVASGSSLGTGLPVRWSQQGQGQLGTIFFSPTPNSVLTINMDTVGLPIGLAVDSDPEAIPYPWTDAVPFYAAYLALMSAKRLDEASIMFSQYKEFALRGRQEASPTVLPENLPGTTGAKMAAQKGLTSGPMMQQQKR